MRRTNDGTADRPTTALAVPRATRARLAATALALALAIALALVAPAGPARSDTAPPTAGTPPTVSAEVLPTLQINGVVWAQTIVGNTVYATGSFSSARPSGAKRGVNEVARQNILAYDLTTGKLLPFKHDLNAEGRAITASPDGSRVYVGGRFTRVDGKVRNRVAAFRTSDGALVSTFTKGVNATVRTIAASNSRVYVGGSFSAASGQPRGRLAAFDAASGAVLDWKPAADAVVTAMVMAPGLSKVVFGGSFGKVNGTPYYSIAAADAVTGKPLPWASQSSTFPIRNNGSTSGITHMSANDELVFLTGYNFGNISKPGGFEGRAAISPINGNIVWVNDCHGDSNASWPVGDVLYSVGHAHDCQPAGAFPEQNPRTWYRALAEGTRPTHLNGRPTFGYNSFWGLPASDQLVWYPRVNAGTYTGQNQGGWSIVGNSSYVSMGGEFTKVNGRAQQGLARFAVRTIAPNKLGPEPYATAAVSRSTANYLGQVTVRWRTTWDRDNQRLTYTLYRNGVSAPIHQQSANSRFWELSTMSFTDSGVTPGSTPGYRLVVTDPFGNATSTTTP